MVLIARFRFKGCGTAQGQKSASEGTLTLHYFESDYRETILRLCGYAQLNIILLTEFYIFCTHQCPRISNSVKQELLCPHVYTI